MKSVLRQGADLNDGVYCTDPKFLAVVKKEFDIRFDLAASDDNAVSMAYYTVEENALEQNWSWLIGWSWLNPPYGNIGVWAKKAYKSSLLGAKILFLVPASVGANWYRDLVYQKAEVRFLNGRLTFGGHTAPYPKDLMLVVYDRTRKPDQIVWSWK